MTDPNGGEGPELDSGDGGDPEASRRAAALALLLSVAAVAAIVGSAGGVGAVAPPETTADGGDREGITIVHSGDELTLRAGPGRTITGETTLPTGTAVSVRIRSGADAENPFIVAREAVVSEFGTFEATFDLSEVEPGTRIRVSVRADGVTTEVDGEVIACEGRCGSTTTVPAGGGDGGGSGARTPLPAGDYALPSVVEVVRGRAVRFPVALDDDADTGFLSVGGPEVNYEVNGTVHDVDGDGRVVVEFRSDAAGFESPTLSAVGDDRVTNVSESSLAASGLLDAGNYDLRLAPDRGSDARDVATLVVGEIARETRTTSGSGASPGTLPSTTTVTPEAADSPALTRSPPPADRGADPVGPSVGGVTLGAVAIGVGGLVAVAGIGLLLGVFRS